MLIVKFLPASQRDHVCISEVGTGPGLLTQHQTIGNARTFAIRVLLSSAPLDVATTLSPSTWTKYRTSAAQTFLGTCVEYSVYLIE